MPIIPLSNDEKQIKAPRPNAFRPIDVAGGAQQTAQFGGEMANAMGILGKGAIRAAQVKSYADDAHLRNVAEREYNESVSELDEQIKQLDLEARRDFQPKYEQGKILAKEKYESQINKVKNFEIREGSKRSISAANQRDAANYAYETFQNDTNIQEKEMGQALLSNNNRRLEGVNPAQTVESMAMMAMDSFGHDEAIIRDFYRNRKGMPADVVDQIVKDHHSKAIIAMARRYSEQTMKLDPYTGYNTEEGLLKWGVANGLTNQDEVNEALRAMQTERLTAAVQMHQADFINEDGTYNIKQARKIANNLTVQELLRAISEASKGSGRGAGAGDLVPRIGDGMLGDLYNQAMATGFYRGVPDSFKEQFYAANLTTDADHVARMEKVKRNKKQYLNDAYTLLARANALENSYVAVNPATQEKELITEKDLKKYQSKGYWLSRPSNIDDIRKFKAFIMSDLVAIERDKGIVETFLNPTGIFGKQIKNTASETLLYNGMNASLKGLGVMQKPHWWQFSKKKEYEEKPIVPGYTALNAALMSKVTALGKAQTLLGFDPDDSRESLYVAYHPIIGYDKDNKPIRDKQQPAITPAQAFAYYDAVESMDALGPEALASLKDFLKKNAGLPEAQKVRAFAHSSLYNDMVNQAEEPVGTEGILRNPLQPTAIKIHQATKKALSPLSDIQVKQPQGASVNSVKSWSNTEDTKEENGAPIAAPGKRYETTFANKKNSYFDNKTSFTKGVKHEIAQFFDDMQETEDLGRLKTFDELAADGKVFTEDDYDAYQARNASYDSTVRAITRNNLANAKKLRMFLVTSQDIENALNERTANENIGVPMSKAYRNLTADDLAQGSKEWGGLDWKYQQSEKYIPLAEDSVPVFFTDSGEAYTFDPEGRIDKFDGTPGVFATLLQGIKENGTLSVTPRGQYLSESGPSTYISAPRMNQLKYASRYNEKSKIPFDFRTR